MVMIPELAKKLDLPYFSLMEKYTTNLLQVRSKYPDSRRFSPVGTRKIKIPLTHKNSIVGNQFLAQVLYADKIEVQEVVERIPLTSSVLTTTQQELYKVIVDEKLSASNGFLGNPRNYGIWDAKAKYKNEATTQQDLFTGSSILAEVTKFFQHAKKQELIKHYPSQIIKLFNRPPSHSFKDIIKVLEERQIGEQISKRVGDLESTIANGLFATEEVNKIASDIHRLRVIGVEKLPG